MTERVTLWILGVLGLCVGGALFMVAQGHVDSGKDIILAIANMLGGAIGGWTAHKAVTAAAEVRSEEA